MSRAYLIAEAGVNHGGDFPTALAMVAEASEAGCDAIKFQVYDPAKLATKEAPAYWDRALEPTATQRDLFNRHAGLTRDDYTHLSALAAEYGIDFIVSVFHPEDVEWLTPLVSHFKIASADITNRELLEAVRDSGKPVIFSTGAADRTEIFRAYDILNRRAIILHCTLSYPTAPEDVNLSALDDLRRQHGDFGDTIGYSDHTLPEHSVAACVAAYHSGARVFEKHFSLTPDAQGNDHYHSLDGAGFRELRAELDFAAVLHGEGGKRVLPCEQAARDGARRSLVAIRDIRQGETFGAPDVTWKRPGGGLQTLPAVAIARVAIPADTTLTEEMFDVVTLRYAPA